MKRVSNKFHKFLRGKYVLVIEPDIKLIDVVKICDKFEKPCPKCLIPRVTVFQLLNCVPYRDNDIVVIGKYESLIKLPIKQNYKYSIPEPYMRSRILICEE